MLVSSYGFRHAAANRYRTMKTATSFATVLQLTTPRLPIIHPALHAEIEVFKFPKSRLRHQILDRRQAIVGRKPQAEIKFRAVVGRDLHLLERKVVDRDLFPVQIARRKHPKDRKHVQDKCFGQYAGTEREKRLRMVAYGHNNPSLRRDRSLKESSFTVKPHASRGIRFVSIRAPYPIELSLLDTRDDRPRAVIFLKRYAFYGGQERKVVLRKHVGPDEHAPQTQERLERPPPTFERASAQ